MKERMENGREFGTVMANLSKNFDCLHHDLLIAKSWFDLKSMRLIRHNFSNRKQSIKVVNAYSSWTENFYSILERSVFGPLIFNIFLCDFFYFLDGIRVVSKRFCNFVRFFRALFQNSFSMVLL